MSLIAIYGRMDTKEGPKRRTNIELKQLYKEPSITKYTRAQMLRWLGHMERTREKRAKKEGKAKADWGA